MVKFRLLDKFAIRGRQNAATRDERVETNDGSMTLSRNAVLTGTLKLVTRNS